jgi:hypothetical protein
MCISVQKNHTVVTGKGQVARRTVEKKNYPIGSFFFLTTRQRRK